MNKNNLKEIVKEQNNIIVKPNIVKRALLNKALELRKNPFAIIISGIRRCGKSTLLNELRKKHSGYFLNFDDDRLINFTVEDFQSLYEIFIELYGEKDIFYFDEIQNIKGWELFIRRLRDSDKKVYITGSNASMLSRELGTHLTGRYLPLTLYPFSFKEFLEFNHVNYSKDILFNTEKKAQLKKQFNEYLINGGFPEYLKSKDKEYLKTLYDNILYRDILVRYNLNNEKSMKELLIFVASNISTELSFNSLKKTLRLGSSTTVKEYFNYLENSYLLFLIPKFSSSYKKQIYANKKAYLIDSALAVNIGHRLTKDLGRLLENLVLLQLKRKGEEINYFKEKHECDFVLKGNAIQVCYDLNNENKEREFNGLLEAMKNLRLKKGLIITYDQEETHKINNKLIIIKPVWKWLLEE